MKMKAKMNFKGKILFKLTVGRNLMIMILNKLRTVNSSGSTISSMSLSYELQKVTVMINVNTSKTFKFRRFLFSSYLQFCSLEKKS